MRGGAHGNKRAAAEAWRLSVATGDPRRVGAADLVRPPLADPVWRACLATPRPADPIMGRTHGVRRGTRYMFSRDFRKRGTPGYVCTAPWWPSSAPLSWRTGGGATHDTTRAYLSASV